MTAKEAYNKALALGIDIPSDVPDAEVERIYNGIGAEWMPAWLRTALTWLFGKVLAPAVFAHDYRYAHGKGTQLDFQQTNAQLAIDGRVCADAEYGWYNPLRYATRALAKKFAKICDLFGMPAYLEAIEETKQLKNNTTRR